MKYISVFCKKMLFLLMSIQPSILHQTHFCRVQIYRKKYKNINLMLNRLASILISEIASQIGFNCQNSINQYSRLNFQDCVTILFLYESQRQQRTSLKRAKLKKNTCRQKNKEAKDEDDGRGESIQVSSFFEKIFLYDERFRIEISLSNIQDDGRTYRHQKQYTLQVSPLKNNQKAS